jgi:hypothetical protein
MAFGNIHFKSFIGYLAFIVEDLSYGKYFKKVLDPKPWLRLTSLGFGEYFF